MQAIKSLNREVNESKDKNITSNILSKSQDKGSFLKRDGKLIIQRPRNRSRWAYEDIQNRSKIDISNDQDLEIILSILCKQPTARYKQDVEILYKALHQIKFISDLEKEVGLKIIFNLLRNVQYETFSKYTAIFNQGDKGSKFYIILSGEVWILVPNKFSNFTEDQLKISRQLLNNTDAIQNLSERDFLEQGYPSSSKIATLKTGQCFGEIALRQQTVRTATVVCSQDSILITATKLVFDQCVSEYYRALRDSEINFLTQFYLFRDFYKQDVEMILMSCKKYETKKNHAIYKENDHSDEIYFIKEGEIQIQKKTNIYTEDPNILYQDRAEHLKLKKLPINNKLQGGDSKKKIQVVPVILVCSNSMFGEQEAFSKRKRETEAVVASLYCCFYSLKLKDLNQIMMKRFPNEYIDQIKNQLLLHKVKHRQEIFSKDLLISQKYISFEENIKQEYREINSILSKKLTSNAQFRSNYLSEQNKEFSHSRPRSKTFVETLKQYSNDGSLSPFSKSKNPNSDNSNINDDEKRLISQKSSKNYYFQEDTEGSKGKQNSSFTSPTQLTPLHQIIKFTQFQDIESPQESKKKLVQNRTNSSIQNRIPEEEQKDNSPSLRKGNSNLGVQFKKILSKRLYSAQPSRKNIDQFISQTESNNYSKESPNCNSFDLNNPTKNTSNNSLSQKFNKFSSQTLPIATETYQRRSPSVLPSYKNLPQVQIEELQKQKQQQQQQQQQQLIKHNASKSKKDSPGRNETLQNKNISRTSSKRMSPSPKKGIQKPYQFIQHISPSQLRIAKSDQQDQSQLEEKYDDDLVENKLIMTLAIQDIMHKDKKIAKVDAKHPLIDYSYLKEYDKTQKKEGRARSKLPASNQNQSRSYLDEKEQKNQKIKESDIIKKYFNNQGNPEPEVDEEEQRLIENYRGFDIQKQKRPFTSEKRSIRANQFYNQEDNPENGLNKSFVINSLSSSGINIAVQQNPNKLIEGRLSSRTKSRKLNYSKQESQFYEIQQELPMSSYRDILKQKVKLNLNRNCFSKESRFKFNVSVVRNKTNMEEFKRMIRRYVGKE